MAIVINKRPGAYSFSGNPVWYELYSDEAAADATVYFEVKIKFKYLYESLITLATIPYYPVAGTAKVDIRAILDSKLEYFIPTLAIADDTIQFSDKQVGTFYIETRQISTAIPDPAFDSDTANQRTVLKGGLNYMYHRGNNFFPNYQAISGSNRFLTWRPSACLVSYNERMYLALINAMDGDTQTRAVITTVHFTDGTSDTVTRTFTQEKGELVFIPSGAAQLGLQALAPAKTIYKWQQQVDFNPGTGFEPLTEVYEYYLDARNDYNELVFSFRNSLGGMDSVRVRGVIETNLAWDYADAMKGVDPDYYTAYAIPAQRFTMTSNEKLAYKGDAGFLTKTQQERLRDMFMVRELWQELRGKWLPLNLISTSFKMRTSDDTLWSMPIEWQPAYLGTDFYTPESVDLGDE